MAKAFQRGAYKIEDLDGTPILQTWNTENL